jgi:hypothetical protein
MGDAIHPSVEMAHPTAATSAMDASRQEGDPEYFVCVCVLAQLSSVEILVRVGSSRILDTHRGVSSST